MKNIIIITKNGKFETWGSLAEICEIHKIKYNTVVKKKFPFEHKGIKFIKSKYKQRQII